MYVGSCGHAVRDSSVALNNRIQNAAVSKGTDTNANSPAEQGSKGYKSALLHARYNVGMLTDTTDLTSVLDNDRCSKWRNMFLSDAGGGVQVADHCLPY